MNKAILSLSGAPFFLDNRDSFFICQFDSFFKTTTDRDTNSGSLLCIYLSTTEDGVQIQETIFEVFHFDDFFVFATGRSPDGLVPWKFSSIHSIALCEDDETLSSEHRS